MWGEIPSSGPAITLSQADREALCRLPRPLSLKGPKIYQPRSRTDFEREARAAETAKRESVLRQCVRLQEALRSGAEDPVEAVSEIKPIVMARAGLFDAVYFPEEDDDNLIEDDPDLAARRRRSRRRVPPSSLTSSAANARLRRSTAEVFSAIGFTTSSEQALQVATDAAVEALSGLCQKLKEAKEAGQAGGRGGGGDGFADCLERALAESGRLSVTGLQTYFEEEVVQFHGRLLEELNAARQQQQQQAAGLAGGDHNPQSVSSNSGGVPMYLIGSQEDVIPEIHFPSSEEGVEAPSPSSAGVGGGGLTGAVLLEHATPGQLETGMQMLQSLEQGGLAGTPTSSSSTVTGMLPAGLQRVRINPGQHDLLQLTPSPAPPLDAKKRKRS